MVRRRPRERLIRVAQSEQPTILGLDCSSATVGWGLVTLELNPKLLSYGHIKPMSSKDGDLITRLDDIFEKITSLCLSLMPTHVAVEEITKFMRGLSTAQTITLLAAFNRVIALAAFRQTGRDIVNYYKVHEIRKIIKNKYLNRSQKIGKEDMPNIIKEYLEPSFKGPFNTKGEIAVEELDEADGIAVAWACSIDMGERSGSI